MVSLGSFGKTNSVAEDEPVTFDWFGLEVGVVMDFNQVELIDLMEATTTVDENDGRALKIVKDMLRMLINPVDFDDFWAKSRATRQRIEDLAALSQTLMEAAVNRPTQSPSDSSGGQPAIEVNSQVVSSSPARVGRPDIQVLREDSESERRHLMAAV